MSIGLSLVLQHVASKVARAVASSSPTGPPAPFHVTPIPSGVQRSVDPSGWLESVWVCVSIAVATLLVAYAGLFRPLRRGAWRTGGRRRGLVVGSGVITVLFLATAVAAGVNTGVGYVRNLHELKNLFFSDHVASLAGGGAREQAGQHPGAAQPPPPPPPAGRTGTPAPLPSASMPTISATPPDTGTPLAASEIVQIPMHAPQYGLPDAPSYVYLPKGYSTTGPKWPLLLLIPAAPGSTDDWVHPGNVDQAMDSLVARHIVKPYVIVMPTVNPSFLVDHECLDTLNGPQVETYLMQLVMPTLEQQLNISTDAHEHAIAGFSAGADCALNVGLHHLDTFSAIGAMDPEGDPGARASHRYLGDRPDLIARNSPRAYIPTMTFDHPLVVYLNAAGALGVQNTDLLQKEFEARGVYVFRHDEKGLGHNWRDARFNEPWMLSFFSSAFSSPPPAIATGAPTPAGTPGPTSSG
jgi:hypothetical protein